VDTAPAPPDLTGPPNAADPSDLANGVARRLTARMSVIVLVGAVAILILWPTTLEGFTL
jgi:hypothetical protein